jgi:hypothetical protein
MYIRLSMKLYIWQNGVGIPMRIWHEVAGTTAPDHKKDEYLKWSGNFDTVLQRHCAYPFK